jgi:hypothetical protein
MTLNELIALLRSVLFSREVVLVTVSIALYINVVNYVVGYRKRPKRGPLRRKKAAAKPVPEGDGEEEGENGDEETAK